MRLPASHLSFLLIATSFALAGCKAGDPSPPANRTVLVQAASTASAHGSVFAGEIRARYEFDLAFRVGGKLTARLVDAGAEVKPGQPLARLDPADLQLAAAAARAQLAAAESDFATASADRTRYAGLLDKKFISQAAFDARKNAENSARGRLEQARAQSEISTHQADYGTLNSAFPAIVTTVLAEPGQVLSAGQAVLRMARPEEKEVLIAVPESRLAELKSAQAMAVRLWAAPELALQGELRELAPAADATTRTYAARIRIINPPPEVRLGMTARVALDSARDEPLLVPLTAVLDLGQGPIVRVVQDGKVASRPIQVLRFREDGVALSGGLNSGELVIVSGAGRLVDGQAVQAKPLPTPSQQR